jgi:uncharacterized membrane protein YgaE (UPF0421/DUF939 family)
MINLQILAAAAILAVFAVAEGKYSTYHLAMTVNPFAESAHT